MRIVRKPFSKVTFLAGSLSVSHIFVSPCPPECYLQSETKIEPDLRLTLTSCVHDVLMIFNDDIT